MQTGTLANWDIDKTRLPEAFDLGVAWLLAHLDAAPGHYEVDGGRVYVAIEEPGTKSPAERRFEPLRRTGWRSGTWPSGRPSRPCRR